MPVTFNGETTNFSGEGAPNPKLALPQLDKLDAPTLACMLAIQSYLNNLIAPSSGGGAYASLTGPGETTTPGALTQLGALTVNDTVGPGITLAEQVGDIVLEVLSAAGTLGLVSFGTGGVQIGAGGSPTAIQVQGGLAANAPPVVSVFTYTADPNAVIVAINKGDLCVDTGTPGLWTAAGAGTVWTAL